MYKFLIAALLAACLISCDEPTENRFKDADFVNGEFKTKVIVHPNMRSINRAYVEHNIKIGVKNAGKVEGYAFLVGIKDSEGNVVGDTCEVHVLEVKKQNDFETWGHELAHCIYGAWHDEGKVF